LRCPHRHGLCTPSCMHHDSAASQTSFESGRAVGLNALRRSACHFRIGDDRGADHPISIPRIAGPTGTTPRRCIRRAARAAWIDRRVWRATEDHPLRMRFAVANATPFHRSRRDPPKILPLAGLPTSTDRCGQWEQDQDANAKMPADLAIHPGSAGKYDRRADRIRTCDPLTPRHSTEFHNHRVPASWPAKTVR
jgi:hypothetical protein